MESSRASVIQYRSQVAASNGDSVSTAVDLLAAVPHNREVLVKFASLKASGAA